MSPVRVFDYPKHASERVLSIESVDIDAPADPVVAADDISDAKIHGMYEPRLNLRYCKVLDHPRADYRWWVESKPVKKYHLSLRLGGSYPHPSPATRAEFDELAERWLRETRFTSSTHDLILHPAYLRIISLGPEAVPLLVERLDRKPRRWLWALRAITGEESPGETLDDAVKYWKSVVPAKDRSDPWHGLVIGD